MFVNQALVHALVMSTLEACDAQLGTEVARRAFQVHFSRLVIPRSETHDEEEDVVARLGVSATLLDILPQS